MMSFGSNWTMGAGGLLLLILVVWTLAWKGKALWKAARKGEKIWFVALLLINTLGILEILYIYVFSKKNEAHRRTKALARQTRIWRNSRENIDGPILSRESLKMGL